MGDGQSFSQLLPNTGVKKILTNIFFFPTAKVLIFPVVIVHTESKSGRC
jgi:hypothetical protein